MIISISGKIGSGKDTVGEMIKNIDHPNRDGIGLVKHMYKWEIKKYAYKLKLIASILAGCDVQDLERQEFKELPMDSEWDYGDTDPKEFYTYRYFLQRLGTEAMRDVMHKNVWINALYSDYKSEISNWIITDTRFPNELEAVKNRGGITIRVNRGDGNTGDHPSETALDNAEFDYVVDNDGTLEELEQKVREILTKEGIL
jgi:hypothetical protein